MKLGKRPRRVDKRNLKLAAYLAPALPPIKPQVDWSAKVPPLPWGMMRNDAIGDCTCAAAGHLIMQWTSQTKPAPEQLSDGDILEAYKVVGQYSPDDPSTDQGAAELDVLNYWRQTGIAGHKIRAFAEIDEKNLDHVKLAIDIFGGAYIGFQLPSSVQGQAVWDVPAGGATGDGAPGSWGGHAVSVAGYDANGLTVITWGQAQPVTWAFFSAYCDEAYAIISPDFFIGDDTPEAIDGDQLAKDLAAITAKAQ